MKRFLAILRARNIEFIRDRSALSWNLLFPALLILGMWGMFSSGDRAMYTVGVLTVDGEITTEHEFLETRYTRFVPYADMDRAIDLVAKHELDLLVDFGDDEIRYWVNLSSPKGYTLERFLMAAGDETKVRVPVTGQQTRYLDWLVPGILGMNMMFSCLFGLGYVVVRYRKNGYLKRLYATPLTPLEFLTAQVVSRLLLVLSVTAVVLVAAVQLLDIRMAGSWIDLAIVGTVGSMALISLGLLVAARINSEELAGGILNMITWPMMLVSGVWFSLEGLNPMFQNAAMAFPLTHMLRAARAVMLEGAGLGEVFPELAWLAAMSLVFLLLAAAMFRWKAD
jgi:ABC-2 type transport system permease protein